jgi:tRNA nucleotidyltransferase/poly(A) polymerase
LSANITREVQEYDKEIIDLCISKSNEAKMLSGERIHKELFTMLKYSNWLEGLHALFKANVLLSYCNLEQHLKIETKKPMQEITNNDKNIEAVLKLMYFFCFNFYTF